MHRRLSGEADLLGTVHSQSGLARPTRPRTGVHTSLSRYQTRVRSVAYLRPHTRAAERQSRFPGLGTVVLR